MLKKNLMLSIALFIFIGCGEKNMEQQSQKLMQTDREFAEASVKIGAAKAFRQYLAEEALLLPDGGKPVYGRDRIYQRMKSGGGETELRWEPEDAQVAKTGDLGYTWGNYEWESKTAEGENVIHYGKYLNVWKKDKDGKWKVLVDMGNQNPQK